MSIKHMRRGKPSTQVTQKAEEGPAISLCGTSSLKHMQDGDLMGKVETNIPCKPRCETPGTTLSSKQSHV